MLDLPRLEVNGDDPGQTSEQANEGSAKDQLNATFREVNPRCANDEWSEELKERPRGLARVLLGSLGERHQAEDHRNGEERRRKEKRSTFGGATASRQGHKGYRT